MTHHHKTLASVGLLLTVLLAVFAFYYVWQTQQFFGRTIEGTIKYACAQYFRANPGQTICPYTTENVRQPTIINCCCENMESTSKWGKYYGVQITVFKDNTEVELVNQCQAKCSNDGKYPERILRSIGKCELATD